MPGPSNHKTAPAVMILAGIILAFAIQARLRLPFSPFCDRDTWGFLFPSLNHFANGAFTHVAGREFPYPLFIEGVVKLFGTLDALALVQHFLGLLTGVILWITWRRMAPFFPEAARPAHPWIGLTLFASYLLSVGPIKMEHTIRPEAIFPLVAAETLYCGIRFISAFFLEKRPGAAFGWGTGLVALAFSLLFIKGAFGLATLAAISPVIAACFAASTPWKFRLGVFALPLAFVGVTLWYPERTLVQRHDTLSHTFAGQHLFAFQGKIIRKEIGDELAGRRPVAFDRETLEGVASRVDKVLHTPSTHYRTLGFDADMIIYGEDSAVEYLKRRLDGDPARISQFYMHYYRAAWRHRPGEMFAKVTRQLLAFYQSKTPFDDKNEPISVAFEAKHGLEAMQKLDKPLPFFDRYIARQQALTGSPVSWREPGIISRLDTLFAGVYRLCAVGALAAALCLAAAGKRGARRGWVPAAWLFLYVMAYGFFNTLTLAIGHTLEVRRYVQSQLTFSLLCVGCGLMFLFLLARSAAAAFRTRQNPPCRSKEPSER